MRNFKRRNGNWFMKITAFVLCLSLVLSINGINVSAAKDKKAPKITSCSIKNNQKKVGTKPKITVKFSEKILKGKNFKKIIFSIGSKKVAAVKKITKNKLVVLPKSKLKKGKCYALIVPAKSVMDKSGNSLKKKFKVRFTTKKDAKKDAQRTPDGDSPNEPRAFAGIPWNDTSAKQSLYPTKPEAKDDFYAYVNYEWLSANASGLDYKSKISDTAYMDEYSTKLIKDPNTQDETLKQLKIMYDQANDTAALKEQGLTPIQKYLDRIDAVKTIEDLNAVLTDSSFPFDLFVNAIIGKNPEKEVNTYNITPVFAFANNLEGGSFYRQYDKASTFEEFQQAVGLDQNMIIFTFWAPKALAMLGYDEIDSKALQGLRFESQYGKYAPYSTMIDDIEYGTAQSHYGFWEPETLAKQFGNFPILDMLKARGYKDCDSYAIEALGWIKPFAEIYTDENIEQLKMHAKLMICKEVNTCIDQASVESGMENTPDIDNGLAVVSNVNTFGHYLSKLYVDKVLGEKAISNLNEVTNNIIQTYKKLIANADWLDDKSRATALEKLDSITSNILLPNGDFIDFSDVKLNGENLVENYLILKRNFIKESNKHIGVESINSYAWYIISPMVTNAFYNALDNSINILPGMISNYFYSDDMSDEELYGKIGTIIAHEIGHAFDYYGSNYDKHGNPVAIYSEATKTNFLKKVDALVAYYNSILIMPDVYCDGDLIKTEALADLSGIQACMTYGREQKDFDFKKFFTSYADCFVMTYPNELQILFIKDSHPLHYLRVNVNLQMHQEFYDAYGVSKGDHMYLAPEKRLNLW